MTDHLNADQDLREIDEAISEGDHTADAVADQPALGLDAHDDFQPSAVEAEAGSANAPSGAAGNAAAAPGGQADDRATRNMKRAQRQREQGLRELGRSYAGVAYVPVALAVNDTNIASSAARFLGMVDRTLMVYSRTGQRYLPAKAVDLTIKRISEMIDEYVQEGKQAADSAASLCKSRSDDSLDEWLTPQYPAPALSQVIQVKNRAVVPLVRAVQQWDAAIGSMTEMLFNGQADNDQLSELRHRERVLFSNINSFCIRALRGLRQRVSAVTQPPAANEAASASQADQAAA